MDFSENTTRCGKFFEKIFRGQFPHPADDSLPGEEIAALKSNFSRR
jgi:hypothetical protein